MLLKKLKKACNILNFCFTLILKGKANFYHRLWKDLQPSLSTKEIDAARHEMWKDFPREGLV